MMAQNRATNKLAEDRIVKHWADVLAKRMKDTAKP